MTKPIIFRPKEWYLQELNRFIAIYHCKNKTEAIHKVMQKYVDLTKPKKTEDTSQFIVGTKVKCLSRNEYFDLAELPCIAKNIFCTNEECWKRIQKLMEETKRSIKPHVPTTMHGN